MECFCGVTQVVLHLIRILNYIAFERGEQFDNRRTAAFSRKSKNVCCLNFVGVKFIRWMNSQKFSLVYLSFLNTIFLYVDVENQIKHKFAESCTT